MAAYLDIQVNIFKPRRKALARKRVLRPSSLRRSSRTHLLKGPPLDFFSGAL